MSWACPACGGSNPDGTRFCGHCGSPGAQAAPRVRDERRLVTAVFADVSGFSGLADRLDPELLQEIIDPVIANLSNVVGRYEGLIEKFAGDALMALFGAPVAHGDDAARALHAALEMHRELARLVPQLPPEAAGLALHIGVNSGHGVARLIGSQVRLDYGVVGDVVVLAQRLEASAPVGETYVGAATHELARRDFEFEAVGRLQLKGRSEPVPAWRLVGARRNVSASAAQTATIVGRDRELASIRDFGSRLDAGRGGAVVLVGEAGLGKTALCEAIRTEVQAEGRDWLATRALAYGSGLAYWPFADLLRRGLDVDGLTTLETRLADLDLANDLPFLARLLGIEAAAPDLPGEVFQRRLHAAVVQVLLRLARRHPTVLMLDDLHWADEPTVALLGEVIAATQDAPLLVLVTSRPEREERLAGLAGPASALRVNLDSLPRDAVATIAARILDGPLSPELTESLLEHTAGNPFFAEELVRSLLERGVLIRRDGHWDGRSPWDEEQVPLTVEGVLAARLDALPAPARALVEVLAVVGRRSDLALVRAVAPDMDRHLPQLVAAGLLDPIEEAAAVATFHHPVTQQVAYSRLVRRSRAELHRRVGRRPRRSTVSRRLGSSSWLATTTSAKSRRKHSSSWCARRIGLSGSSPTNRPFVT